VRVPVDCASARSAVQRTQDIFLLRHSDQHLFSGVDVIAAMISGMAGLLDDRVLLCDGSLAAVFEHRPANTRTRSMLVIGRSVESIRQLKAMLDTWGETLSGDGTMDQACWRACMALAQLDRLLPLPSAGNRYSFGKLAQTLNLRAAVTSFRLSESDLRKVLSILADCWLVQGWDERAERANLPRYAREHGFSQHPPVVAGVTNEDLPKRLYDACRAMDLLQREPLNQQVARILVRAPARLFNHLPRGKSPKYRV
jgi:hypothetical protein